MKYIIGNGISGLIWKHYHPDYKIVAPTEAGGMYAKSHLVWMHDAEETRHLLNELGIPFTLKKSRIGYYVGGWIMDNIGDKENLVILQHKMTPWDQPLDTSFKPRDRKLSLSEGYVLDTNYMNTIDVDLEELVKRIDQKTDVVGLVTHIDKDQFQVQTKEGDQLTFLSYDKLISTIAAPFFWKAFGDPSKADTFKCIPITNIIIRQKPREFDDKYEMVYYDDTVPFSRVSHLNGRYAIEFTGYMPKEEFQRMYPDYEIIEYFVVAQGRIFQTENYPPTENIIFSGRFAQWIPGIVTENVISQAINHHDPEESIEPIGNLSIEFREKAQEGTPNV